MLTNVGETTIIPVTGSGSCVLTLLLVGGGGRDAGGGDYRGGAGSGYLEYRSSQVSPGTVLTAQVGRGGEWSGPAAEASSLTFSSGDTFTAQPGQDNVGSYIGGAGYSGNNITISGYNKTISGYSGGGGYGGAGGTNGGNGEDGDGGAGGGGTGEDVSLYTFRDWLLTPGSGGQPYGTSNRGGGGGGLMVDGTGPEANQYQGQGFGGGGNGLGAYGLPGLILLEIN